MRSKTIAILSDLHVPYHDQDVYRLVLRALRRAQPDILVVLGDLIDCYAVSAHAKQWRRAYDWQDEIDQARVVLGQLADISDRCVFIAGNHEDRWPRYLARVSPQDNRRSNTIQRILGVGDGTRWSYTPYQTMARIGKVLYTHDLGRCGKYAAHWAAADAQHSVVIGHTHRAAVHYDATATGTVHVSASFGWLGDFAAIDYMHQLTARRAWTHGFGWGHLEPSGVTHLTAVPVVKGRCCIDGKIYR